MAKNQTNTQQAPAVKKTEPLDPAAQLLADQAAADQANANNQPNGDQQAPATPPAGDTPDAGGDAPVNTEVVSELFRVGQPLAVLIVGGGVDIQPLIDALRGEIEVLGAPAGLPSLEDLTVSLPPIVARYADFARNQKIDLENIVFTVADPATDESLKTINFMRSIQGLGPTFIYPVILTPPAAE